MTNSQDIRAEVERLADAARGHSGQVRSLLADESAWIRNAAKESLPWEEASSR